MPRSVAPGKFKKRDPSERPAIEPEWVTHLRSLSGASAQIAIRAYDNAGMKKAETSCNRCLKQHRECLVVPGGPYQKCVSCTANPLTKLQDCNADFTEKPTQASRLREAIDAVRRMYDNKPDDSDMELVQKAAEEHSSWIALRGYYPDLRPEEASHKDHPNQSIQQLREKLWTPKRLQSYPRGSRTDEEPAGYRPGQQERAWRQRVSWGGELPHQLEPYDTDVRNVCAYLDHLDDPRVGSSQTPKILARDPTSFEQGAKRRYRLFDKQMLDSILLKSIDKSINELRGHSPKYDEDPDVEDTRHTLIQALKNFRRAYTYWLFPDAVFGNSNMNPVLEGSSNDSPDTQDSFRGNRTKRENGAEREGRHKFRRGSDGGRLSGHQEAEDYD